jgi:excisionase family DNA binding protein
MLNGSTAGDTTDARLVTASEVAERLGVHVRTVHRLKSVGKLPAPIRFAGSVRWRLRDLLDWIDAGCPAGER